MYFIEVQIPPKDAVLLWNWVQKDLKNKQEDVDICANLTICKKDIDRNFGIGEEVMSVDYRYGYAMRETHIYNPATIKVFYIDMNKCFDVFVYLVKYCPVKSLLSFLKENTKYQEYHEALSPFSISQIINLHLLYKTIDCLKEETKELKIYCKKLEEVCCYGGSIEKQIKKQIEEEGERRDHNRAVNLLSRGDGRWIKYNPKTKTGWKESGVDEILYINGERIRTIAHFNDIDQ